ncbi:MAG TPA: hypothetical protein VKE72_02565 [Methylocella sp.]|nr:hypothetical protein [Methylocella sp.]
MLQREADRNDHRKTDDGTSTVTTNKTKNYVTSHIINPRQQSEEIVDVAFAFASAGLRDFALSTFFRTPVRRGLSLGFAGWREDEMDRAAKSLRRVILAG